MLDKEEHMSRKRKIVNLVAIFCLAMSFLGGLIRPAEAEAAANLFVTREGDRLMLGGSEFRFVGANAYGLMYAESPTIHLSTDYEILDWFKTFKEMGFRAVRFFPSCQGAPLTLEPSKGVWNETAWERFDYVVKTAGDFGIKLIIPFVDNYHYYHGGKHVFTDWEGVPESEFYTNEAVIDHFKEFIARILNRVNTYTGVAYKDDPTILAWESGNELQAPQAWTSMIAAYVKSIDSHHLFMDGNYGISCVR
jgi:endo-1,4-beta-mannosidase